jgi:hypothetical protein
MWDVLTDRFRICTVVLAVVEEGLLMGGVVVLLVSPRQ